MSKIVANNCVVKNYTFSILPKIRNGNFNESLFFDRSVEYVFCKLVLVRLQQTNIPKITIPWKFPAIANKNTIHLNASDAYVVLMFRAHRQLGHARPIIRVSFKNRNSLKIRQKSNLCVNLFPLAGRRAYFFLKVREMVWVSGSRSLRTYAQMISHKVAIKNRMLRPTMM